MDILSRDWLQQPQSQDLLQTKSDLPVPLNVSGRTSGADPRRWAP
jgi:hypothetical protein